MLDLLKRLVDAFGVSGNETQIRKVIEDEIKDLVDEVRTDVMGNLIAVKKGRGKKIMVAAHMDEIGVIATHIDDKGFIRFSNVGGLWPYTLLAQKVRFSNGVVGSVYYEKKLEDIKKLKLSNMYIDIGAGNKEEADKKIRIGDTACFVGETIQADDMVISKSLDNRSGCAVVIEAIKNMPETENEIYYVFTSQEEVGLRGAKTAAYQLKPDMAIAIDVTATGDTPESPVMEVKCGSGPAIKVKDSSVISHPKVRKLLEECAKEINIPYQLEVLSGGGTDIGSIHVSVGGVPSGAISIPCRYIHTPVEMVSLKDLEYAVKLLVKALCNKE
ncbi:MAG TPA: M42 family metallopeptidase [Clostridiaceae bacterium]|nr:M42 family metallopeptidase [Clostridiaceae bacterium]